MFYPQQSDNLVGLPQHLSRIPAAVKRNLCLDCASKNDPKHRQEILRQKGVHAKRKFDTSSLPTRTCMPERNVLEVLSNPRASAIAASFRIALQVKSFRESHKPSSDF
jgi:hypothetical protein